jgi:hypothetical protein
MWWNVITRTICTVRVGNTEYSAIVRNTEHVAAGMTG